MFSNEKNSKKLIEYVCEKCDFVTCNKNDFNRHNKTKKHISNDSQCFSMVKTQKNSYECICGKNSVSKVEFSLNISSFWYKNSKNRDGNFF